MLSTIGTPNNLFKNLLKFYAKCSYDVVNRKGGCFSRGLRTMLRRSCLVWLLLGMGSCASGSHQYEEVPKALGRSLTPDIRRSDINDKSVKLPPLIDLGASSEVGRQIPRSPSLRDFYDDWCIFESIDQVNATIKKSAVAIFGVEDKEKMPSQGRQLSNYSEDPDFRTAANLRYFVRGSMGGRKVLFYKAVGCCKGCTEPSIIVAASNIEQIQGLLRCPQQLNQDSVIISIKGNIYLYKVGPNLCLSLKSRFKGWEVSAEKKDLENYTEVKLDNGQLVYINFWDEEDADCQDNHLGLRSHDHDHEQTSEIISNFDMLASLVLFLTTQQMSRMIDVQREIEIMMRRMSDFGAGVVFSRLLEASHTAAQRMLDFYSGALCTSLVRSLSERQITHDTGNH